MIITSEFEDIFLCLQCAVIELEILAVTIPTGVLEWTHAGQITLTECQTFRQHSLNIRRLLRSSRLGVRGLIQLQRVLRPDIQVPRVR